MNILVIGNGFDKQHGLKTGYYDFVEYCKAIERVHSHMSSGGGRVEFSLEDRDLYNSLMHEYPDLYDEFIELLNSFWVIYFTKLKDYIGDKWLNFESEIERVVRDILSDREIEKNTGMSYDQISTRTGQKYSTGKFSCRTYKELFVILGDELHKLNRALEIYLCTQVEKEMSEDKKNSLFEGIHPDKLLSFNYTRTYLEIYDPSIEADYIHGKADIRRTSKECNLVLGFDDHYFEKSDTVLELVPFEKYYQRIVNRTGNDYYRWLDEKNENGTPIEKHIYFYGHSMSPADGDIIKSLLLSENSVSTIFYRKGHEEERAGMIQNLAVVLSPDELIRRTGGANPSIEFKEVEV